MPLLSFRREIDAPPPERELLTVEDGGDAAGWRSTGRAIGRFRGPVPDLATLADAVAASAGWPEPVLGELVPDASIETLEVGGRVARFVARRPVADPWAGLVDSCRSLLDGLPDSPEAAILGELASDGRLRLVHAGAAALEVDLGEIGLALTMWRDGREAAKGRLVAPGPGRITTGPGWSLDLERVPADLAGGGLLVSTAAFVAFDGARPVSITLTTRGTA